jgi:predicted  nucleic acid-binding Zn-ribbon protein
MPYKCVHCSKTYSDGAKETLTGCECGSKFFFYISEEKLKEIEEYNPLGDLEKKEKDKIEEDIREIAGMTDEETPIFLDFESIMVVKPGKYLVDIAKLFAKDKPRIYKLEDGKYIIDLQLKTKIKGK